MFNFAKFLRMNILYFNANAKISIYQKNPKKIKYYPPDFHKYLNLTNFNNFLDNFLILCPDLTIELLRTFWILAEQEEEVSLDPKICSFEPNFLFGWLDMHFQWCVKNFYECFLENHAYNFLINDYMYRKRIKHIKLYLKAIPKLIKSISNPSNFTTL